MAPLVFLDMQATRPEGEGHQEMIPHIQGMNAAGGRAHHPQDRTCSRNCPGGPEVTTRKLRQKPGWCLLCPGAWVTGPFLPGKGGGSPGLLSGRQRLPLAQVHSLPHQKIQAEWMRRLWSPWPGFMPCLPVLVAFLALEDPPQEGCVVFRVGYAGRVSGLNPPKVLR